jgi:hypothetical protein
MSYTIEKIPGAPIVVLTLETRHILAEMDVFDDELTALLDSQPEPVFMIHNMINAVISLEDLTIGASATARGPGERLHHPNVRDNLLVTHDGMMKLAVSGLRTATFGNVKIRAFDTREQAIAYCHEQIAVSQNK